VDGLELGLALLDRVGGPGQPLAAEREIAPAVVHSELAAPGGLFGARAASGLARSHEDVHAVARGAPLGVGTELLDDPNRIRVELAIQEAVVDVDPGERVVVEREADPVKTGGGGGRPFVGRPGARVVAGGRAPVDLNRDLGPLTVALLLAPAQPVVVLSELGERAHAATPPLGRWRRFLR
jgi:hypothetical protein